MNHLLVAYAFLLPISKTGNTAVILAIVLLFISRRNFSFYLKPSIGNPVVQAFLLVLLIHIVWLLGTTDFSMAGKMINIYKFAVLPLLLLSFIDQRFGVRIVTAFMLGMLYSEILSYLINFDILPWRMVVFGKEIYESYNISDPSPFLHRARYATALSITIALFANQLMTHANTRSVKIFSLLFMITATVNLFLVGGRIGYVIYVVLLIALVFMRFKKRALKPLIFLLSALTLVMVTAYQMSPLFKIRIDKSLRTIETLQQDHTSFNSSFGKRLAFWYYGSDVILEHPLFGTGTGDHMNVLLQEDMPGYFRKHVERYMHPHNEYLSFLMQFGIVGLLVFLNIFYQIFKYPLEDPYKRDVLIIVTLAIGIAIMTEEIGKNFYLPMFITLIAAAIAKKEWISAPITGIDKRSVLLYVSIIGVALLIAFFKGFRI